MTEHAGHPVEFLPELAMGVLPPQEAAPLRAHLAECETCRDEYEEMARVTRLLPLAAEERAPAPELRSAVLDRIAREPRSLDAKRAASPKRRWLLEAAAAVALIFGTGVAAFLIGRSGGGDSAAPRDQAIVQAAAQGTLQTLRVQDGDFQASLVRAPGASEGFAWLSGMPALPGGKAYQAWFTKDGKTFEPSTVFRGDGGVWLPADGPIDEYAAIGFTVEDSGGAKQPTQAPFAVVDLAKLALRP